MSCDTMPTKDVQADPAPAQEAVAGSTWYCSGLVRWLIWGYNGP